jgi:hypothetical protein
MITEASVGRIGRTHIPGLRTCPIEQTMDFPDVGSFRPLWISTMTHVRESEISPMREIPPAAIMGTYERIRSSLLGPFRRDQDRPLGLPGPWPRREGFALTCLLSSGRK